MSHHEPHADHNARLMRFVHAVEEETRRWGGKHLLTSEEYLEIVNRCYRDIFGESSAADNAALAG